MAKYAWLEVLAAARLADVRFSHYGVGGGGVYFYFIDDDELAKVNSVLNAYGLLDAPLYLRKLQKFIVIPTSYCFGIPE